MATGISKTKWNGTIKQKVCGNSNGLDIKISYDGKKAQADILNTQPALVVDVKRNEKLEPSKYYNGLYYGDNLPILSYLFKNTPLRGKIKLIYIDPPFSTKSVYQSREQKDAYCDLLEGAHYIEFLRERLILLRELLSDDGSIYVHLDENMAFYIKAIMDEIFGRKNFRNWITRKKCNPKNYTRRGFGNISDFILFYTKTEKYIWNDPFEKWTKEHARKEYQYFDRETKRFYKKVPVHAPGVRNGETGKPWKGMNPPPGKHWQFPPKTLEEMDQRGEIYWSQTGNPRRKIYFDNSKGIYIQDIWLDFPDAHNQNIKITGYPTEKNPNLLRRIINTSSKQGDIALDCFCGSGTTLAIASELKRNWIGIDNSLEAIKTTLNRFLKGSQPMGDYVNGRRSKDMPQEKQHTLFQDDDAEKAKESQRNFKPIRDFIFHSTTENLDKIKPDVRKIYNMLKCKSS